MPITTPNLKIGCLVGEDLRRDFVAAIKGDSADVRWSHTNPGRCSLLCIAVCPRTHVLLRPCIHVSLCRCLVSEEQRRDIVEAMEGNSADVRWSQIRGAVRSSCLGHKVRRRRDPQGLKSDGRGVCNRHKKGSTCKREALLRD